MGKIVEICCGGYSDALYAFQGGAKRIELNSALHLGGLTPTLASLLLTKRNTDLKVIAMVRPRAGGFCYSDEEFEVMKKDAHIMMQNGADGIAFGCLDHLKNIHISQTKEMIDIIHHYHGEAVFHRAFDCVNQVDQSIQTLIDLGIDRLLTSGLHSTAIQGKEMIAYLQQHYGQSLTIMAGSGVNSDNVISLIQDTQISQVHSSCKCWLKDETTSTQNVSFHYHDDHRNEYESVSLDLVKKIVEKVKEY